MASVTVKRSVSYSQFVKFRKILRSRSLTVSLRNEYTQESYAEDEPEAEGSTLRGRYPGHRPTSVFQKALLTAGSAAMALYSPDRGDMVATLGDVTAEPALKLIKQRMEQDPVGRQILEEKPQITSQTLSIDYLGSLGDKTFGKEYWRFLTKHGFSPDARLPVHYVDEPDLVYVMSRYRQCHDLFHTVLGMKPNMLGECVVKWVEAIQLGLPMCALGAMFGPLRLGPNHRQKYLDTYLPWAIRNGQQGKLLMNVYFEQEWERDLSDLREELNIEDPPEDPYPEAKRNDV
ncbi:ubiquinone biosynthesis protein COQ4 homolog, mitochondrial-like [Mya arenaria]|uniref:ubiquinone biosynthesis protein COQ4 homolog, mitochondrial-like n=1 Tax=Mya arenaria TaxID=6604 RepID=UPI0022DF0A77|nr:ubiquinone biosynthesis protein COQ4 homolog, mitochondrial-like [Mya arenaria]